MSMALRGTSRETTGRATEEVSRPESELNAAAHPMTEAEYIESIRDGPEICLDGERIKDVTTYPAFLNSVRMTARS
jgi:4-hydroxyphenylacetate 3-monooxygenase